MWNWNIRNSSSFIRCRVKLTSNKYSSVTLIDIDPEALKIAQDNINNLEIENIQLINIDVFSIPKSFFKKFDIIITNPPFGIRSEKSADIKFLKKAINVNIFFNCFLFEAF